MNWDKIGKEWAEQMTPFVNWYEGTEKQQEFADELIRRFCKRFAKYLCWCVKEELITESDVDNLILATYDEIKKIYDPKWWCNKKSTPDTIVIMKLLKDYDEYADILKKIMNRLKFKEE